MHVSSAAAATPDMFASVESCFLVFIPTEFSSVSVLSQKFEGSRAVLYMSIVLFYSVIMPLLELSS